MKYLFVYVMCALPLFAAGWGQTGHRTVGLVADQHLSAKAKKAIARILEGQSLAQVSTWMDEVRSDSTYNFMTDWHWVTVETGKTYAQSPKNPNGDVIETIQRVVSELKKHTLDKKKEAEYLKILAHLVGDIHMPLHVGCCDDQGGNKVKVKWFRTDSNLHRVWDQDMIDDTHLSFTELAGFLGEPSVTNIAAWQKNSVLDWASESMALRQRVYAIGDGNLGYKYSYVNFPTVKQRLQQAGIRLAGILNQIYG